MPFTYDQAHRPFPYDLITRAIPSPQRQRALELIRRVYPHATDTRANLAPVLDLIDRQILDIEPNGPRHFLITTKATGWSERHRESAIAAVRQIH